ncbi:phage tail protein [Glutamicibacter creatinolyticus]|uniref:phage tail protein n=1 Tax=Glutamicibacter creatinolyticus TaxID=162496 RepID=UPI003216E320
MWSDRFAWSGEIPTSFPGLNPVALQRVTPDTGVYYKDGVTPSRLWERVPGGSLDGYAKGQWGLQMGLNLVNPATDKGRFKLPHFSGLWPSSGKLLIGLWVKQNYVMGFSPLLSTRGGSSPVVYLSTSSSGRIRHQVYNASGGLVLDQYEDHPWVQTKAWQFVGMIVDYDGLTSQMFSVDAETKATWAGPVRSLSAAPNKASTADLDVFGLQTANYWTAGVFDEALVAHPGAGFDLQGFIDAMANGLYADAQSSANADKFTVTESSVKAVSAATFSTGAESVAWQKRPIVQGAPSGAVPRWSTNDGDSWSTGAQLPDSFTGLLRWDIPLKAGESFTGISITEPIDPPPTLAALADVEMMQGEVVNVPLTFTVSGSPKWTVDAPGVVNATITGSTLSVVSGFEIGAGQVTVTLTDELDRSVARSFDVSVKAREWEPGEPPKYPHAPIVVWGESEPEAVIINATDAVVTKETNGEEKFEFAVPSTHKHAGLLINERRVEVADETYTIRRVATERSGRQVFIVVYAEARFYDLATAGQIDAQEFVQVAAGDVMAKALAGTGWKVGVANVTTLRTYEIEDTNPLALLREVQSNHGGDLVFDNDAKTVSLVVQSGRDNGVGFFYGKGLTDAKKVVDTTSLVTRIYARNADGLTIAGVNGGVPYIENFEYTNEVRSAVYDFKSGTSPYTMLSMAQATLANRSKPDVSYEVTVNDLSARSDANYDRFDVGDRVTVVDHEVGIADTQRIVRLEYDVLRPWASKITLSAKLRELSSSESVDAGVLDTGAGVGTFDLVPFNLLLNGRFDNGLAHWANFGAEVVDGDGTGDNAVRFSGPGERYIEQTVAADNRRAFAFSFDMRDTGPAGYVPDLRAEAVVTYEDGSSETIELELS